MGGGSGVDRGSVGVRLRGDRKLRGQGERGRGKLRGRGLCLGDLPFGCALMSWEAGLWGTNAQNKPNMLPKSAVSSRECEALPGIMQVSAGDQTSQEGPSRSYGLGASSAKGADACGGPGNGWTGPKRC